MISIQTFDQQEPITILKDLAGIKSQEVRFEKIEMSLFDMLNAAELEEIYVDLLVADMYEKQKSVYAQGTRPSTQVGQKRVDPKDSFRKQVKNDPDSTQKVRERVSQLEESTLRTIYQKNGVKESQGERSKEEKQAEKERYIQSYIQYSDFMNRAKQEKSQSNSSIEVHSAGAEGNSKAEVNSILSAHLGNAQDFLEKSGLDLLLISQKPEYLSKKEDTSKLYSRFTYFEKVIGPQIFGAELGILIGAVAIVASVFTGGTSLVLLSFAAGGVVLGAADIAVNAQKLNDLYNGDYDSKPTFLGMNQDVLNVLGLLVGVGEIGAYGLKGLFKAGDYAALARNMDELAELDDLLRNANRYDQNEIRARIEAAIAQNRAAREASNMDLYLINEKNLLNAIDEHKLNMGKLIDDEGNFNLSSGVLNGGSINESQLISWIPPGVKNGFRPDPGVIDDGFKYNFIYNGTKVEIKWHSPQLNLSDKLSPTELLTSNSYNGWTAQIKVGNKKFLGADGNLYRNNQQNIIHIPVNIGR